MERDGRRWKEKKYNSSKNQTYWNSPVPTLHTGEITGPSLIDLLKLKILNMILPSFEIHLIFFFCAGLFRFSYGFWVKHDGSNRSIEENQHPVLHQIEISYHLTSSHLISSHFISSRFIWSHFSLCPLQWPSKPGVLLLFFSSLFLLFFVCSFSCGVRADLRLSLREEQRRGGEEEKRRRRRTPKGTHTEK